MLQLKIPSAATKLQHSQKTNLKADVYSALCISQPTGLLTVVPFAAFIVNLMGAPFRTQEHPRAPSTELPQGHLWADAPLVLDFGLACAKSFQSRPTLLRTHRLQPTSPLCPEGSPGNNTPFPSPRDLPDPGIKPMSSMSPALACEFFTISTTGESVFKPHGM